MNLKRMILAATAACLLGCVTINIYFPEAAAQQAADRIIDEVRGAAAASPDTSAVFEADDGLLIATAGAVLDWRVPPAAAAADFDAQSPASRALEQSLKARYPTIKPFLDSGAVGLTAGGLLDIRDRNAIPLADRNRVRQLVTDQNTDWEALYREIARINGHPEWIDQIRKTFAERWAAKAPPGWYFRDAAGNWQQK